MDAPDAIGALPVASGGGRRIWLPAALFAGLMIALYADPLFVRRNFAARDLSAYNLPMEKSVHDAWARGHLPVWTPEVSGGRPLMPNPNAGALYPARILLSGVPFPLAMRLYPVAHWIAAGIGVILLCLSMGRSAPAAWIAAATYTLSGVGVSEVFFPHIQPGMTLLPWIVWAVARRSGSSASRLLVLALLLALDLLAADVFTIALALACAAAWIVLEDEPGRQARSTAGLAAASGIAALAAAPQIVATMLWIPLTNRAVLGMKLSDIFLFSIHPWRLAELLIPFPFGPDWDLSMREMWGYSVFHQRPMGIFSTLYPGAFAVIAIPLAWRSRVRGVMFSRVVLLGSLLVSVTPALLPSAWLAHASPLPLRNPEKFAVALVFALSLLAAIGFDSWRERPRSFRALLAVGILLTALSAACRLWPGGAGRLAIALISGAPQHAALAARHLPGAFAEAGLLWMLTVIGLDLLARPGAQKNQRQKAAILGVILLTAVPAVANRRLALSFREEAVFAPTAFARFQAVRDPAGAYRALGETIFQPESPLAAAQYEGAVSDIEYSRRNWLDFTPVLFGRGTVFNQDFDVGDLSRVESLRKVSGQASGFADSDAFFGAVSLKWGIRYRDQRSIAGYHAVGGDALQVWDEHPQAYPDIRLLEQWIEAPSALAGLRALASLPPGAVVIESGAARSGSARPGTLRVVAKTAERLDLAIDATDPGWLFVLRAFWPYREIRLDGRPVEASPGQLAFCAVPIPAGAHRLEWRERVPGLEWSRWGPVLFGIAIAGLTLSGLRRRRKR